MQCKRDKPACGGSALVFDRTESWTWYRCLRCGYEWNEPHPQAPGFAPGPGAAHERVTNTVAIRCAFCVRHDLR